MRQQSERLRHWIREVRHELFEYEGRTSQLVGLVEAEVPAAIGLLNKLVGRIEEYQSVRRPDLGPARKVSPPLDYCARQSDAAAQPEEIDEKEPSP